MDVRHQRLHMRLARILASLRAVNRIKECLQRGNPRGRERITLVSQIIRVARKPVNRDHGRAQPSRHQPGGHRKVFVVIDAMHGRSHRWIVGVAHASKPRRPDQVLPSFTIACSGSVMASVRPWRNR